MHGVVNFCRSFWRQSSRSFKSFESIDRIKSIQGLSHQAGHWLAAFGSSLYNRANLEFRMDRSLFAFVVSLLSCISLSAQWLGYPTPGIPRTPDGKPNLAAPTPRTPDGKPDLSGVWAVHTRNSPISLDADPNAGASSLFSRVSSDLPYRPGMAEMAKARAAPPKTDEPITRCLPTGIVVEHTVRAEDAGTQKIVQTPGLLLILFEFNTMYRQIFTDGRPLPTDPQPAWNGYSVGKWEGDTLVVETIGLNGKAWLDASGDPMTDAAKITERFRRPDFGRLQIDMTVDDPKAYTKPFTFTVNQVLLADTDLLEMICAENEKDIKHMLPE
jgi:hypothetical protein